MRAHGPLSLRRQSASALAILGAATASTLAAELLVPQTFPTIQAAIDAAAPGDTILVSPGTYSRIDLKGKAIVVRSTAGPESTIISGGNTPGYVVTFSRREPRQTLLDGFTITGAISATSGSTFQSGGIRIQGASPTIANCIIAGNQGVFGGGVWIGGGAPAITDSSILSNSANVGGGLYSENANVLLTRVRFAGNSAINNGGGAQIAGGRVTLHHSFFTGNTAQSLGAALNLNSTIADIQYTSFDSNGTTEDLGGAFIHQPFGGGAVYTTGVSGTFNANTLTNNNAYAGAGLYLAGNTGGLIVSNTLIANNTGAQGVGVYINGQGGQLVNITVANNRLGGGVFATNGSNASISNSIIAGHGSVNSGWDVAGAQTSSIALDASIVRSFVLSSAVKVGQRVRAATDPRLDANFVPREFSPAIDAGENARVPASIKTDLAGKPRFFDDPRTADTGVGSSPLVDLGAFEFQRRFGALVNGPGMPHRHLADSHQGPASVPAQ